MGVEILRVPLPSTGRRAEHGARAAPRPPHSRRPGRAVLALLATILVLAQGCDKARAMESTGEGASLPEALDPATPQERGRREILFQVFGTRDHPRMVPIAAIAEGRLEPLALDAEGWRRFDATYLRRGRTYALYHGGVERGVARVQRGMWEAPDEPLYVLAGCRSHTPLAAVKLDRRPASIAVEMLASTARLGRVPVAAELAATPPVTPRITPGLQPERLPQAEHAPSAGDTLAALELRSFAVQTGATARPTVVASWMDSSAISGGSGLAPTRHLFVIADADPHGVYRATYVHQTAGPLGSAEFRRYVDRLDITRDGVDELILEGWRYGGGTFLSILGFREGKWSEIYRTPSSWCLDAKAGGSAPRRLGG